MLHQLSQVMPAPADITVYAPSRIGVLVVECKQARESTAEAAAHLRRNLLGDGYLNVPHTAFFMLAFPTALYLWRPDVAFDAPPDFSAAAKPLLREYLGDSIADQRPWPGAESMQLAISGWLGDLAGSIRNPDPASDADQMLVKAGVYGLIQGGAIRRDIAP
jgi:hypothetical protein